MAFSKVTKPINIDENFWELNPWLKIHPPYSKLYKKLGNKLSSKYMIAIFLMCEPDEEANPFFRMDEDYRKNVINEEYVKIDWSDELVQECLDSYPFDCMDSVERAFKEEKEQLKLRARFIKETPITLDRTEVEIDPTSGKKYAVNIKGTATQLETMRKNTDSIYKQYEKIEDKFIKGKTSATVRGGRKLTKAEKKEL